MAIQATVQPVDSALHTSNTTDAFAWLAQVMSGHCSAPNERLTTPQLLACAHEQGVVSLVDWQLQKTQSLGNVATTLSHTRPAKEIVDAFAAAARQAALVSMLQESEARFVLNILAEVGLPVLLLKGMAVANWAYSSAHLRECGDVDFLLPTREAAEVLAKRLTDVGYERLTTSGDLVAYELLCRRPSSDLMQVELDIHWRLSNSPLFANVFTFDELMASSITLPQLGPHARGLGLVHSCIHACIHRTLNLSIGIEDKLKWLYDLELMMASFTPNDWHALVNLSVNKGIASLVCHALEAAALVFGRQIPATICTKLQQAGTRESLDCERLAQWGYMQRKTFESLPTLRLRLRWLWQRLFPSNHYLEYLHNGKPLSYQGLVLERLIRGIRRLRQKTPHKSST